MQHDKMQSILQDLYALDPGLREYGDKLNVLLEKLLDAEPDAELDERFAAKLRHELMAYQPKKSFLFNFFNNMNKVPIVAATGVLIVAIVFATSVYMNISKFKPAMIRQYVAGNMSGGQKMVVLGGNAFGRLSFSGESGKGQAANLSAPAPAAPLGMADSRNKATLESALPGVGFGGGGGAAAVSGPVADSKMAVGMIAPDYNYLYSLTYTGDDFKIENTDMPVYRLMINSDNARSVAESVLGASLGFVNLSGLSNVSVGSMSLSQGRDGYNIYMNFEQGRVSIDRNQSYSLYRTMPACEGPGCMPYEEPKYEMAEDNVLISKAEEFIAKFKIDKSAYGMPFVDKSWQKYNYGGSYIPRFQSVVYPLVFDGKPVLESGNYINGMRVNIDLADLSAQGANDILNPLFEQSKYELETDFGRILQIVQKGGVNGMYYIYGAQAEGETLNLGTPEYVYMHQYDYQDGYSFARELYLPALKFPIVGAPQGRPIYQDYVIVPLVKEILDNYESQNNEIPGPAPMPMPFTTSDAGVSEPGFAPSSDGEAVAPSFSNY